MHCDDCGKKLTASEERDAIRAKEGEFVIVFHRQCWYDGEWWQRATRVKEERHGK